MTREELNTKNINELADISVKLTKKMDELKGYASGMCNRERLKVLGKNALIDCILVSERMYEHL